MSTQAELIVLSFPTPDGAKEFLSDLAALQHEHLIRIVDANFVVKKEDGRIQYGRRAANMADSFLSGSLWGALAGFFLLEPISGLFLGGSLGLLLHAVRPSNSLISDELLETTARKKLEPQSSAVFLMVTKATPDKLMQRLSGHKANFLFTSLSVARERELREAWKRVKKEGSLSLHQPIQGDSETRFVSNS